MLKGKADLEQAYKNEFDLYKEIDHLKFRLRTYESHTIDLLDTLQSVWDCFHPTPHKQIDRVDMLDEVYYTLLKAEREVSPIPGAIPRERRRGEL